MLNVQTVADLAGRGAELYRNYVPADWIPYPNLTALGVLGVGILLAFWGARLLRTIYILGFMVVGAAQGFKIGSNLGIDTLIGLTFGAGIAALLAYIFFRWWVGVTTGVVAVLIVAALAWPRLTELDQGYRDSRLGVGSAEYPLWSGTEKPSLKEYAKGLSDYAWTQRREIAGKLAVVAGVACVLGMVLGLVLPRFTTILGTSLVGVGLAAGGIGVLIWRNWPETWKTVVGHPDWYLVGMGALLIVSAWRQTRSGRAPAAAPAPPPSPPEAPAAPGK